MSRREFLAAAGVGAAAFLGPTRTLLGATTAASRDAAIPPLKDRKLIVVLFGDLFHLIDETQRQFGEVVNKVERVLDLVRDACRQLPQ